MVSSVLRDARRIVVKVGSSLVTNEGRGLDEAAIGEWSRQLAALVRGDGGVPREVVMVSSGAIAEGMKRLGWATRPQEIHELQAAAAVGQMGLAQMYETKLREQGMGSAQVLLTHADLADRERYLNARSTLLTLLRLGVVPVINENDTVVTDEIKFGDNDHLAAMVANITEADLVISMTNTEGLFDRNPKAPGVKKAKLIGVVREITDEIESMATAETDPTGMGGMRSKVLAARKVTACGIPYIIARGKKKGILGEIFSGKDVGTLFLPMTECLSSREYWIAFTLRSRGKLFVDDGARKAIVENGKSLLPPGITRCEGDFEAGEVVRICDADGTEFARGIASFGAGQIAGRQLKRVEVVHRDNLVIL